MADQAEKTIPGTDVPATALEQAFEKVACEQPELFDRLMAQLSDALRGKA